MEEQGLLELTGAVEEVQYHNEKNQYTVLQLATPQGDLVTVVGAFPFVSEGEELRVYGTWGEHPTYGEQFMAQAFDRARPATTAAMLKYLSSGAVKGVGPAMARRIIQTFGAKSLEVMEQEPERLAQVKVVANKVRTEEDEAFIIERIPEEDLLGMIHYNTEVMDADRQGKSPYDFSETVTGEIRKIKEKIDRQ